jgi:hypothetical protein
LARFRFKRLRSFFYRRGDKRYGGRLNYRRSRRYGQRRRRIFSSFVKRRYLRSNKILGMPVSFLLMLFGGFLVFKNWASIKEKLKL